MKSAHTARFVAAGVVAALAVATAAPAGAAAPTVDPGVSKTEIVIGTTTPLTGPASPGYKYVAPAAQA
ncbi:MAG: ABC transporter substrate-binding protein, partial [Actinobacteria bacterium]|nr:ABC transporter substrate-binding protein [Actinomycetota bacterium]